MVLPLLLIVGSSLAVECPVLAPELAAIDASSHCLTMPLRDAWLRARETGAESCLSAALADRGLPVAPKPLEPPAPPASFQPDKLIQDSYGLPNNTESENFIAWWGDGVSVDSHAVDDMLDFFEEGWAYEVDLMELPPPETSDSYKFNVYVGDTGSGAPSVMGNSGYFWYDPEGFPMIVMNVGSLDDDEWCRTTAVHELFHAVQAATDNYNGHAYKWIWEATAVWVEGEVYQESATYASFLFGFAYLPYLPLDFYDYPDTGALTEYHQYGAFIFPRYLSEVAYDWTLVRDIWSHGSTNADPLEVLEGLLAEHDATLVETWADFTAHNVAWDYQHGTSYEWVVDAYEGYYDNHFLAASYANAGVEEWQEPTQRLPQRYGVNNYELRYPNDGTLQVELELDPTGSSGSEATWSVTLVRKGTAIVYEPLEVVDGAVQHSVPDIGDDVMAWLVVGASAPRVIYDEDFGYRLRMWVEPELDTSPPEDTGDGEGGEDPKGCGCDSTAPLSASFVLFALGAAVVTRRRGRLEA